MKKKNRILLYLIIVFVLVTVAGSIYILAVQNKELDKKDKRLAELKANYANLKTLQVQLKNAEVKVAEIDSLLFEGKFTIRQNLPQSNFFNFVDTYSDDNTLYTYTNTEFVSVGNENGFNYYSYKVSGNGTFDDVYGLVYAIEHSKELKKIESADVSGATIVDSKGIPHYLLKFNMDVKVYFSSNDQFAEANFTENNLTTGRLYNAYFPLVRNQIRPNIDDLPDVQGATLLSLVPQGAFITDSQGNTILLKKGDRVYLGYLDDIDYENKTVTFVLNKGGILEYETLKMGIKNKKEGK
jgi:hypothetical protein